MDESKLITVCIVDDDNLLLQVVENIIDNSPGTATVGSFSNAEDLLREYENLLPDIILMDIDLPGMSGIEATSSLKTAYPKAIVLMLTIFHDDKRVFSAIRAGADGYLLKKDLNEMLLPAINESLNGGARMSAEIATMIIQYFRNSEETFKLNDLTNSEKKVLELIVKGYLYKEMASTLDLSIDAIKKYSHKIYNKLHVRSRSEAVKKFLNNSEN